MRWDNALGLGLMHMGARHYSPTTGRFLQPDPDRSEANLYAYAQNSPVTEIDPDGTCFILCVILIPLAVGAIIDAATYAATTDGATIEGALGAVAGGAPMSLMPWGKVTKAKKVVDAFAKIVSKFPRASRATKRFLLSREGQRGQIRVPGRRPTLKPDSDAVGPHSTFRRDRGTGRIEHYATWKPNNGRYPRYPEKWIMQKRYDGQGPPHVNRITKRPIKTPHVQGRRIRGGARPARVWEIPR